MKILFWKYFSFILNIKCSNMPRGQCKNAADSFCYICGLLTIKKNRRSITPLVKKLYSLYFGCEVGDQDKEWAPHVCCATCFSCLSRWSKNKGKSLETIEYPDLRSARRPVSHSSDVPIPTPPENIIVSESDSDNEDTQDDSYEPQNKNLLLIPMTQSRLNDLVRDLGLTKQQSELLASRLKEDN